VAAFLAFASVFESNLIVYFFHTKHRLGEIFSHPFGFTRIDVTT
jgi:hypothetical protein